jgi:ribonuclease HI
MEHKGQVRATRCTTQNGFLSLKAVEAQAALMALHLCKDMGFSQIQLERDAQRVINAI